MPCEYTLSSTPSRPNIFTSHPQLWIYLWALSCLPNISQTRLAGSLLLSYNINSEIFHVWQYLHPEDVEIIHAWQCPPQYVVIIHAYRISNAT